MKLTLRLFLFLVVLLGFTCEKKQDKTVFNEREPKGEMDLTNWDFQSPRLQEIRWRTGGFIGRNSDHQKMLCLK
jgi:hypothetical protein